jgi:hypothetical protein
MKARGMPKHFSREPTIVQSVIPRSAGTSRAACGIAGQRLSTSVYVPGEGWVEWDDIAAQVAASFRVFCLTRTISSMVRRSKNPFEAHERTAPLRAELTRQREVAAATNH